MAQLTTQQFIQKFTTLFADNTTGQVEEKDLREFVQDIADSFGGSQDFQQLDMEWNEATTYDLTTNKYAEAHKRLYKSKTNDNIGHLPPSAPNELGNYEDDYWIEISQAEGSSIKEWTPGLYGAGLVIVSYNFPELGDQLVKLNVMLRPFESTNIVIELSEGKWGLYQSIDAPQLIPYEPVLTFANQHGYNRTVELEGDDIFSLANSSHLTTGAMIEYKIDPKGFTPDFSEFIPENDTTWDPSKYMRVFFYYDGDIVTYTLSQLLPTPSSLPALATPLNVVASSTSSNSLTITWEDVADEVGFEIQESDTGVGSWIPIVGGEVLANVLSFIRDGLPEGTTKHFRVRAKGNGTTNSNSGWSSVVSATTGSGATLPAPILTVVTVDSITNGLSCTNVDGELGFEWQRSLNGVDGWAQVMITDPNVLSLIDDNCTPEVQYFYRVRALGNGSTILTSGWSAVKNVITQGVLTPTLSLVSGDGQITVNIGNIDPNVELITLERSIDQINWAAVEEYVSPNNSAIDGSLTDATRYYYRATVTVKGKPSSSTVKYANILRSGYVGVEYNGNDIWLQQNNSANQASVGNNVMVFEEQDFYSSEAFNEFTVNGNTVFSAFVKIKLLDSVAAIRYILQKHQPATNQRSWAIQQLGTKIRLVFSNDGSNSYTLEISESPTGLIWIGFTFNQGTVKAYINKVERSYTVIAGTSPTSLFASGNPLYIGANNSAITAQMEFEKAIISNTVLSQSQINALI